MTLLIQCCKCQSLELKMFDTQCDHNDDKNGDDDDYDDNDDDDDDYDDYDDDDDKCKAVGSRLWGLLKPAKQIHPSYTPGQTS